MRQLDSTDGYGSAGFRSRTGANEAPLRKIVLITTVSNHVAMAHRCNEQNNGMIATQFARQGDIPRLLFTLNAPDHSRWHLRATHCSARPTAGELAAD